MRIDRHTYVFDVPYATSGGDEYHMEKTEHRLVCDWCKVNSPAQELPITVDCHPPGWMIDDTDGQEHHFCCNYHYAKWLEETESHAVK